MRGARASYLAGAIASAVSQALSIAAGIVSLWLLTRILPKEMFGAYAFAMSLVTTCSIIGLLGLDRALVLRVAAASPRPGVLKGTGLVLKASAIALGASLLMAAALWLGADALVTAGAAPEAAFWLPALALAVVPLTLSGMMQAWFQSNHRVAEAVALPGVVDVSRAALLGLVLLAGAGARGVAVAVVVAAWVPVVVLGLRAIGERRRAPRHLRGSDVSRGLLFLTQTLSNQGLRQFDLVLVGLLASGLTTADYALAARIARLCDTGRLALKPTFMPRARRHLQRGAADQAATEFHHARIASFATATLAAAAFAAAGGPLLALFGSYQSAYGPLLLLTAGYLINAGTGMHATYLAITGEVLVSALMRIVALTAFVFSAWLIIPPYGAIGGAAALLVVLSVLNGASLGYLRWRKGFMAAPVAALIAVGFMTLILAACAFGALPPLVTAAALLALLALSIAFDRHAARFLRMVIDQIRGAVR